MDIFGFKTQGVNYDKFRPRYPSSMIQSALKYASKRNRYLDIACGTGQLLFKIAPYFQQSLGMDISPNMISTAQGKLESFRKEHQDIKVNLQVNDFMTFDDKGKYDLITIGQALHFLPISQSLKQAKKMLTPEGCFMTWGYVIKEVISQNQKENLYFNDFYSKVKPLFTFDRDDLHTFYSQTNKYPFQHIFPKVQRDLIEHPMQLNKQEYLSYLKTMSGYNLYLQQHGEDPLEDLRKVCSDNVTCILYYFRISCRNE